MSTAEIARTAAASFQVPSAAGGMTERVARLRDAVLSAKPGICLDRVRFYTEIHKKHECQPIIMRRALAFRETMEKMRIWIDDAELVVGSHASRRRAAPLFPEYSMSWMLDEIDQFEKRPGDPFFPTDEDKKAIREIIPWWEGKSVQDKGLALMTGEMRDMYHSGLVHSDGILTSGDAHIAIYHRKLLEKGLDGYLLEIKGHLAALDNCLQADLRKRVFYEAAVICLEGMSAYIGRFERLAREQAKTAIDLRRRRELEEIAEVCGHVKRHPARNFREALQLTCFSQIVLQIESNGHSLSFGRLDQYLYPYYEKDIADGGLSEARAVELLQCLWVKILEISKIRGWKHTRASAGGPLYQNVTIGGQTPDGKDAVNPLSYLILRSVGGTRLPQPNLSVRYHAGLPDAFLMECLKVIEIGFGMPAFNNDEIVVPEFIRLGVEARDARDYSAIGCIEVAVPGRWGYRCTGMSMLNFMRVLLCAVRNGKDVVSGKTFLPGDGALTDFGDFGRLMRAWEKQAHYYARVLVMFDTAIDTALEENVPDILCSVFTDDCLARGKTIKEGGSKYDYISGLQIGIANLGNSLAAIRKLIFDEKLITAEELMRHLAEDFAGPEGERVRLLLLNHAPKFGNDDDYVDDLTAEAYGMFIDEYERHVTTRHGRGPIGCGYFAGTSSVSANVPQGAIVPATPDGRKAGQPLAEGSSPSSGTDRSGMTAIFKSIAKLPTHRILGGVLLNQKLTPPVIKAERDKEKLAGLLRTFFEDLKGWHVQYNIVDRETLLAAKKDPEKYRDLVIRVAGYSAFFTVLAPDTQDDIIARTEQTL